MFDSCSLLKTIERDIYGTVLSVGVAQHHRQTLVAREFLDGFDVSPDRGQASYSGVTHYMRHGRMSREDAARYLGHRPKTLAMWALSGKGPRSVKVGGRVFYFLSDLDAFVRRGEVA
jgi:hypothetical protein